MATIKVFDSEGVREIHCFDTLDDVPYVEIVEETDDEPEYKNPFE